MSDLSKCGDACNCMKCNPSKSSCIASRAAQLGLSVIDQPGVTESDLVPVLERFVDIPDGTVFYLAQTYAYGGRQKLQKTMEDGDPHNAVYVKDTNIGLIIPDDRLVIRA